MLASDWNRRRVLLAISAACTSVGLAGCGGITSYEFRANPVVLPDATASELGYREVNREVITTTRSQSISGVNVDATIKSHLAVYDSHPASRNGQTTLSIGVLGMPAATVFDRSLNPLQRMALQDLITSDPGERFLRKTGLNEVVVSSNVVRWVRGPTNVGSARITLVDTETIMQSFAGILDSEDGPVVVFVHLARIREGDQEVVIGTGVNGWTVERVAGPYVGEGGFITERAFSTGVAELSRVSEKFVIRPYSAHGRIHGRADQLRDDDLSRENHRYRD